MKSIIGNVGVLIFKDNKILLLKHNGHSRSKKARYWIPTVEVRQSGLEKDTLIEYLRTETGITTNDCDLIFVPRAYGMTVVDENIVKGPLTVYLCTDFSGLAQAIHYRTPIWTKISEINRVNLAPGMKKIIQDAIPFQKVIDQSTESIKRQAKPGSIVDPFTLPFQKTSLVTKLKRYFARPLFQEAAGCYVFYRIPKTRQPLFLLIRRSYPHEDWSFPRGNMKTDKNPKETALRETLEETALKPKIIKELSPTIYSYYYDPGRQKITTAVHYYLAESKTTKVNIHKNPDKSEFNITDFKWVPVDEAIKLVKHSHEKERFKEALVFLASL